MKIQHFLMPVLLGASLCSAGEYREPTGGEDFARMRVNWTPREEDRAIAARAWEMLSNSHRGLPRSERKLRVVYVTFRDRPALPGYRERYDRIMKNIQAFYADQMKANGYPALTFELELDEEGKVVVHEAYVDKLMAEVGIRSSGTVAREAARKALAEKGLNLDNEHILLVCQLPDGVGPYYGAGNSHTGIGYTCDQPGLDPLNFCDPEEMKEARYPMTRGRNTTVYVGGTTHELGHGFGLPHTGEDPRYPDATCRSLMGDGNHTYGNELRGEGNGSYLAPADAMKLASSPLFCGVETTLAADRIPGEFCGSYEPMTVEKLEITPVPEGVRVKGKINPERKPYGVTLYLDPPEDDPWVEYDGERFIRPRSWCDYDTSAVTGNISPEGEFDITINRPGYAKDKIELRITVLNANGSRGLHFEMLTVTPEGFILRK
ncbi:MAG: hypothetical protein IJB89_08620 [Akkermansia sp.]|nr:hypothetical protein [Akkermansia sp.]